MEHCIIYTRPDGGTSAIFPSPGFTTDDVMKDVPADATNVQVIARSAYQNVTTTVPHQITFAQLLIGLVAEGWITEAEGDGWLAGTLPAAALTVIATLPEAQRFAARTRALRPSVVVRGDPLVIALAGAEGITSEQLDQFFVTYSQV